MDRNDTGVERVALVQEQGHPEIYLVYGNTKFHVPSPERMDAMGLRWDKVEVVPEGSLADLATAELGGSVTRASTVFFTTNPQDGSKDPASRVQDDVLIAGWLLGRPEWHVPSDNFPWVEDVCYELLLDVDFIERLYGPDGLSNALRDARLPGNVYPYHDFERPAITVPFGDMAPDAGGRRYATANAFHLPGGATWDSRAGQPPGNFGLGQPLLHIELNCWQTRHQLGPVRDANGVYQVTGRGSAPPGWVNVYDPRVVGPTWIASIPTFPFFPVEWSGVNTDCWWPFDPNRPDGQPSNLQAGDSVLLCGTIWQDQQHGDPKKDPPNDWEQNWPGQGGWLEMHPPDWIHRLRVDPPLRTAFGASLSTTSAAAWTGGLMTPGHPFEANSGATVASPPVETIDYRFNTAEQANERCDHHGVTAHADNLLVTVDDALKSVQFPARSYFAAGYVANWSPPPAKGKEKEKEKEHGKDAAVDKLASLDKVSALEKIAIERIGIDQQPDSAEQVDHGEGSAATFITPDERPDVQPGGAASTGSST